MKPFKNLLLRQAVLSFKRCRIYPSSNFQYSDVAKFPAVFHNKYKHHKVNINLHVFLSLPKNRFPCPLSLISKTNQSLERKINGYLWTKMPFDDTK
jgi:hypothetical protein